MGVVPWKLLQNLYFLPGCADDRLDPAGYETTGQREKVNIMTESLYEKLGGTEGITRIAADVVENHLANPAIATRFKNAKASVDELKNAAATFFITGTGGPQVYHGKNLLEAHKGMNISGTEFMAALDDILAALQKNNISQRVQEEVLFVLYSMRSEVVAV
jgi:hemoglobin